MTDNQLTDPQAPVPDEELDQMIWKLERDGGMTPKMLSLMRELRKVRKARPLVDSDLLHTAASAIEDLLTTKDRSGAHVWYDMPMKLRKAAQRSLNAEKLNQPVSKTNKLE